ncbi:protein Spindly-like [Neltuma alba]|uniref:protein Spindly-like n=1 Tax=Neltuma alba TaxID=207710 RepID=UPI0010A2D783|nr:protein Spindly-like [Prosopis alba]
MSILLSACTDSTRELQMEIERRVMESDSNFVAGNFNNETVVQANSQRNNKYMETAQKLINATTKTQTFIKQLELRRKEVAATVEDLQSELNEARAALETVINERDHNKSRFVQLESDIQTIQSSCRGLRNDLEDYHALQEKFREKEAEISSLYSTLSTKEQENERSLFSTSEATALSDKIDKIEIPIMESGEDDMERHTSTTVKKLFHIIDFVTRLRQHVNSLSHDKEELQLTLDNKVLEVKRLNEEVNQLDRNCEDSKNGKDDDSEISFSLEKILDMLGASDWNGDKKSAGAKGLITVLEKQVMTILLGSEKSKSRDQELSTKLLGDQKVIDELTAKVKLLEHSIQNRTSQPEFHQERSIFEVAASPVASEISEVEEGSLGKKATSSVLQAVHMLNMRKGSTDHLLLDIDSEPSSLINKSDIDDKEGIVIVVVVVNIPLNSATKQCHFNSHLQIVNAMKHEDPNFIQEQGRPLPKFGEWDVNDPASAEGFTVIFNKARDEKKTGGASGRHSSSRRIDSQKDDKKKQSPNSNSKKKWFCFGP